MRIFYESLVEKYTIINQDLENRAIVLFKNYLNNHRESFLTTLQLSDDDDEGIINSENLKEALV